MRRKAIKLATNTLVISLPSKWAQRNNIIKGSELELDEKGSYLILKKSKSSVV
ncbi:AbrB/MazE/SpoVT family DNA-binding domain-containing protein, partial [Nanoarchaeota archaeon]